MTPMLSPLTKSPRAALAALAALLVAAAAPTAFAQPQVTTFMLENGMKGVVIEDHRAPVVTHMVWYRVGAADEPHGHSGIAHFFEHLMFKGTDDIPDSAFSKIISSNGGQDNAFTGQDYTAYFQRIAADRLELVMTMEADRMRDLVINDDHIRTERDVVLEERNQRVENDPGALFNEQLDAALYLNHPYGIPVIGWKHEISALNLVDARAFYERWYAPDNAILVVAGDVNPAEVQALAEKHFGPLKPSGVGASPRMRATEPPQLSPRRLTFEDPRVRQPYVTRTYVLPSAKDDLDRAAAREVLAEVLGGGVNSRIAQALTIQSTTALSAGAWHRGGALDYSEMGVYVVPRPGVTLGDAEAALDKVLADFLASDGPTDTELARIKSVSRADKIYSEDSQMTLARIYGAGLTTGLTIDDIQTWQDRIDAVTAEDVMEAARAAFDLDKSVTGWLMTAPANPEEPRG
ncbi:MAG: zinc protease [Paracoccaceae bacterium]|jgi:zinc protease